MNWEAAIAIIAGLEFLHAIITGIPIYLLNRRSQLRDQAAQAQTERIEGLEKAVTHKAEEVVKQKFDLLASENGRRFEIVALEIKSITSGLNTVIEGLQKRLERGDQVFREQAETHQELVLRAEHRDHANREWARERFGSKEELAATIVALQQLQIKIAKIEQHLGTGE